MRAFILGLLGVLRAKRCTIEHDLSTKTTECNPATNTAMAFFYYDTGLHCEDEREEDPETG